ncbi:hypothetical protein HWV62_19679 [Athelia sp. TMB]|nr:hypothetical protein HWV62_19679 [Athelia sp. TMB]
MSPSSSAPFVASAARSPSISPRADVYPPVRGRRDQHVSTAATFPFPPDPNSSASAISSIPREITETGGEALAVDVTSVPRMLDDAVKLLIIVYDSGTIFWAPAPVTPLARFQLMQRVNPEGLYAAVQAALPHFAKNDWRGRVIVVSPPIYSRFFCGKTADAILAMLRVPTHVVNGLLALDEDFLKEHAGVMDFSTYSLVESTVPRRIMTERFPDLRVVEQDDEGKRRASAA